VLYDSDTGPTQYREWLHDNAVRFVVLPDVRLDPYTGDRESSLVRDRRTGLEPVLRTADVTIYAVPDPTPLLTGPNAAEVTRLAHDEIRGSVAGPGDYRLRLAWSPHWEVMDGDVTIEEDPSGQISVRAARAGPFRIGVRVDMPVVSAEWLL